MKKFFLSISLILLVGCGSPTGFDDFQSMIGSFCSKQISLVTRNGNDASVRLTRNTTMTREITDNQGFRREQTIRGCITLSCEVSGGAGQSDADLIRLCEG